MMGAGALGCHPAPYRNLPLGYRHGLRKQGLLEKVIPEMKSKPSAACLARPEAPSDAVNLAWSV